MKRRRADPRKIPALKWAMKHRKWGEALITLLRLEEYRPFWNLIIAHEQLALRLHNIEKQWAKRARAGGKRFRPRSNA